MSTTQIIITDGGRVAAGFKDTKKRGDCVTRAIAIATGKPYLEVWQQIEARKTSYRGKQKQRKETTTRWIKTGTSTVQVKEVRLVRETNPDRGCARGIYDKYLAELGWKFTPLVGIGTGCKVHLRADELPAGRIIARVSKHLCAVIDGVIHDTYDPSRDGTRCVYGYYSKAA